MKKFTLDIVLYEYTGNYAADLVGYCTGKYCEGNAGKSKSIIFNNEETFRFDNVEKRVVNKNLCRPFIAKGNQIKIFFKNKPSVKEVNIIKRRCQKFLNLSYEWFTLFVTEQLMYTGLCDEYSNYILNKERIL